jgi:putative GTP pyrophosphokinase
VALQDDYLKRFDTVLKPLAGALEDYLKDLLQGHERIDRISARPKAVSRFLDKAAKVEDGKTKYEDPLNQIQDQIGARVVCFYLDDVRIISKLVSDYFKYVELKDVVPEKESEFGYFGKHYISLFPKDVLKSDWPDELVPQFFELQIKTLFQHAWSEADHDLAYKPGDRPLNSDQNRRVAFTAAQAWGADRLFNELAQELLQQRAG